MRRVLVAADKDIRRFFRDPVALAFSLGIPLLLGGVMLAAMGGTKGPAPHVHLLVADEDDTFGIAQHDIARQHSDTADSDGKVPSH